MAAQGDLFGLIGTTIAGKYRVDCLVGEGGFGVVYAGMHLVVGEPVAIKCLKPAGGFAANDARATELFLREARVLFALTHPAIVRLYDVGAISLRFGTVPYVVLELLVGASLDEELARRVMARAPGFSAPEIAAVFDPVLDAVAFAHDRGVAHRDLKPSNVMLVRGGGANAKVVDFGIARMGGPGDGGITSASPFTPRYAAPEQWDPNLGPTGAASDVFSLGLMLSEACTLVPAVRGDGPAQLLAAVMDPARRPTLAQLRPDLPPALDAVIARASRTAPHERYRSAREMLEAMRAALGNTRSALPHAFAGPGGPPPIITAASSTTMPVVPPMAVVASTRGGAGKWILGIVAVLAVTGVIALFGVLFVLDRFRRDDIVRGMLATPSTTAPPPATPTTTTPSPPVAPLAHDAGKAGPLKGTVKLTGVTGTDPFWTNAEIYDVVQAHIGDLAACNSASSRAGVTLSGPVDITVIPDEAGRGSEGSCDVRGNHAADALALCTCMNARVSSWQFPAPHGHLGLLRSGAFIVTVDIAP